MTHTPHFDDCGCLSAKLEAEIAMLNGMLQLKQNDWIEVCGEVDSIKSEIERLDEKHYKLDVYYHDTFQIYAEKNAALEAKLERAVEIIELIKDYGPSEPSEKACWFCDMGEAGYSAKGSRFHDDKCLWGKAEDFLQKIKVAKADE